MADEKEVPRDPTPVEQMQVGEMWKTREGRVYLVTEVDAPNVKMQPEGRGVSFGYDFVGCTRAGLYRVKPAPKRHSFTDRYAAARHVDGSLVMLCVDCGMPEGGQDAPGVGCVPRDWRADLEKYVAEQMMKKDLMSTKAAPHPRFGFRQSNPLICGGVFSLRDELDPKLARR